MEKKIPRGGGFYWCQVIWSVWGRGLILYGFHWPELLQADPKNLQGGVYTGSDPLAIRGPIQTIKVCCVCCLYVSLTQGLFISRPCIHGLHDVNVLSKVGFREQMEMNIFSVQKQSVNFHKSSYAQTRSKASGILRGIPFLHGVVGTPPCSWSCPMIMGYLFLLVEEENG